MKENFIAYYIPQFYGRKKTSSLKRNGLAGWDNKKVVSRLAAART